MPVYRKDACRKHRTRHAKIRADERYCLDLTRQDLQNIVGMIQNKKAIASHRISNSKSVKLVRYQDKNLVVLYSNRHKEIITFLPIDCGHAKKLEAALCD